MMHKHNAITKMDRNTAAQEILAIQEHLRGAETLLRQRNIAQLTSEQCARRAFLVEALRDYRGKGVFPQNDDFSDKKMPYFIDAHGVRCAMAHLVEITGGDSLVHRVAREQNNGRIAELVHYNDLRAWLEAYGLTAEEAARIQPSYGPSSIGWADGVCYGAEDPSNNALFRVKLIVAEKTNQLATVRLENVYGQSYGLKSGDEISLYRYEGQAPVTTGTVFWFQGKRLTAEEVLLWQNNIKSPLTTANEQGALSGVVVPSLNQGKIGCPNGLSDLTLSAEVAASALLKGTQTECKKALAALDERWDKPVDFPFSTHPLSACNGVSLGGPTPRSCSADPTGQACYSDRSSPAPQKKEKSQESASLSNAPKDSEANGDGCSYPSSSPTTGSFAWTILVAAVLWHRRRALFPNR